MHSSTFSALTIQFKLYAAYLFTAVFSFAASSCLQSTYLWDQEHHTQLHVLGKVRSGSGMETEWKQNGMEMEEMRTLTLTLTLTSHTQAPYPRSSLG